MQTDNPKGMVRFTGVSKRFRKHTVKRHYSTVKSTLLSRIFKSRFPKDNFITALENVSIEVPPGSALGVIGRNGSGKSTLLKLLAGIYRPDSGSIAVGGRISALIELGAGFHPDFTGRENIYLGGVMYGLSRKEIDRLFDQIVGYAELEDFIDDPVRTYSSGMYMRLGFSLAIHTDPDVLLVDEVLAVGDAAFVHRCRETISEFRERGKTLILVTHDLDAVERWCESAIWLEHGVIRHQGEPRRVIDAYLEAVYEEEERELREANRSLNTDSEECERHSEHERRSLVREPDSTRWGNGDVDIGTVALQDRDGAPRLLFHEDETLVVEVAYTVRSRVHDLVFGIGILRADGVAVFGTNTEIENVAVPVPAYECIPDVELALQNGALQGVYRFTIHRLGLNEGTYYCDVAVHAHDGTPYDYHHRRHKFSIRCGEHYQGVCVPAHSWEMCRSYPCEEFAEKTYLNEGNQSAAKLVGA